MTRIRPTGRVRQSIQDSRLERLKGDEASLAKGPGSAQASRRRSECRGRDEGDLVGTLAQAELDSATSRVTHPQNGVEASNREIARLLWEIADSCRQVNGSTSCALAYRGFEPKEARAAVQQQVAAATGGPDKPIWMGQDAQTAIPSLAAVQQEAARGQGKVVNITAHPIVAAAATASRDGGGTGDPTGRRRPRTPGTGSLPPRRRSPQAGGGSSEPDRRRAGQACAHATFALALGRLRSPSGGSIL